MFHARTLMMGLGLGAGCMYFCDPTQSRRRQARLRDQCTKAIRRASAWFDKAVRDASHRIEGTIAETQAMFDHSVPTDQILCDRVRATLGRHASHPRLIKVQADQGHVTLTGNVPEGEMRCVAAAVSQVRGVQSVDNRLDTNLGPDVDHHQHNGRRSRSGWDIAQETWAPATQLTAGTIGGALMLNCLMRRTPGAILLGTLGFGLFLRAAANCQFSKLGEHAEQLAPRLMKMGEPKRQTMPTML
ncbi:MAG TPA: BON domain-containing protein [Pirellulales bacterium]|nr:BON domain-containing protein [Pirellulales bacterium]